MPKFLETKLKKRYGKNSSTPYKIMNSIGAMKGNKETSKGKAMEMKHESHSPIRGLSSNESRKKKKSSSKEHFDPFAKAMNK